MIAMYLKMMEELSKRESSNIKYKVKNIRISRTGRLVEMFKSLREGR